jgi:hypothetical protein
MTLHQRPYRSPLSPQMLIIQRLHREQSHAFGAMCDMVSIPRDLRRGLFAALIAEGYATDGGRGQLHLTALGTATASAQPTVNAADPRP